MSSRTYFRINVKELKEFVLEKLTEGSALRDVILAENDDIDVHEFLAKMGVWLRLLRRES